MIPFKYIETMSLSRKFVLMLLGSVCSIALLNILTFYFLYNSYIRIYLSEKIEARKDVTIEYINNIIERQTLEDIDNIFSDVEIEFFELLDINKGKIPLEKEENVNIVVDFLIKSGVTPKYIEEVIPENNLEKILLLLKDPQSAESQFVSRLLLSLVLINILILLCVWAATWYFTKKIILPIKKVTSEIQHLKVWKYTENILYHKKDEIGLLIDSINNLNKRLALQENIRSRLLADISHELKTPITSIQCYLEWISDGVIELSEKTLTSITSEMSRLIELVNQIMEYEKFDTTELHLHKTSQNPYEVISQLQETQEVYLREKWQNIQLKGSKNIEIFMDKDLFLQLVYNIIWNFIKYAGINTTLTIDISSKKIIFSDNGSWISKKEVPFLFEKFYQGKKEKTGDIRLRGIGVGLSIVKKIVEVHDWNMKISSDVGKGFSFEIIF